MADFGTILVNFLYQLVLTAGIIIAFGFLISLMNKTFYNLVKGKGRKICYATGFIGTPVHELGHAAMCLLFGHKIVEIKLFSMNPREGTLGYVKHTYNKKNLYHRVGNFFIGVGPIIFGCGVLALLAFLMLPKMFGGFLAVSESALSGSGSVFVNVFKGIPEYLYIFFSFFKNGWWWVYIVIGIMIALHMNLSPADIKGSGTGLIFYSLALFIANLAVGLASENLLLKMTGGFVYAGAFLLNILLLSLIFSVGYLLVGGIIYLARKPGRR